MIHNLWTKVGLALAGGGAMAGGLAGLPAVGQQSPPSSTIIMAPTGTIFDRGVAADVPVSFVCGAGDQGQVSVSLNERSGNGIAQGSAYLMVACTGAIQTVTVRVFAGGPYGGASKPFVNGTAYGQSSLYDYFIGLTGTDNHNVRLSKK